MIVEKIINQVTPKMSDSEYDGEDGMVVEEENDVDDSHDDEIHKNNGVGESSGSSTKKEPRQVYLPGHQMQEDESLIFDPSAYHMLHDVDSGMLQCLNNKL